MLEMSPSRIVAGLDEVGMGSWAGPLFVVVAAFDSDMEPIEGVDDSKRLTPKVREKLAPLIVEAADYIGVGWSSADLIDRGGLSHAWQLAAMQALHDAPELKHLYVDGQRLVASYKGDQSKHEKGESKFWEIAAASVVAKVLRDNEMRWMAEYYPAFKSWERNSGYGSKEHQVALLKNGPTSIHRMFYLRKFIAKEKPLWANI